MQEGCGCTRAPRQPYISGKVPAAYPGIEAGAQAGDKALAEALTEALAEALAEASKPRAQAKTDTKTKAGAEAERQTTARPREAQKTLVGKRGAAKADCESPAARDVAGRQTAREEGIGAPAELEGHQ